MPKLFNCLPTELRTIEPSLDTFKSRLDAWMAGVCDFPATPGRHHNTRDYRGRPSNSLLAWAGQPDFGSPIAPFKAPLVRVEEFLSPPVVTQPLLYIP